MTGVLSEYQRKGIATAMKVLGIRYARHLSVNTMYATHGISNDKAIAMNRNLGFFDAE
jgi:RimJ/RimL family protein N-acetyltransferase